MDGDFVGGGGGDDGSGWAVEEREAITYNSQKQLTVIKWGGVGGQLGS